MVYIIRFVGLFFVRKVCIVVKEELMISYLILWYVCFCLFIRIRLKEKNADPGAEKVRSGRIHNTIFLATICPRSLVHIGYKIKIGQDFLDVQYIHFIFHCSAVRCLTRAHRFPAGNLVNYLNLIEVFFQEKVKCIKKIK